MITSGAYRIGPFEVESVPVQHPAAAAVVGKDDPARTEIVTAFCTLPRAGQGRLRSPESWRSSSSATPLTTKPGEIHVFDEMLRTISGKIRRSELRGRQDKS